MVFPGFDPNLSLLSFSVHYLSPLLLYFSAYLSLVLHADTSLLSSQETGAVTLEYIMADKVSRTLAATKVSSFSSLRINNSPLFSAAALLVLHEHCRSTPRPHCGCRQCITHQSERLVLDHPS